VLDVATALKRLGGDTELLREIQDDFLDQFPGKLRTITLCQQMENWEEAAMAAHSLKNIVGAVGAEAPASWPGAWKKACARPMPPAGEILAASRPIWPLPNSACSICRRQTAPVSSP